MEERGEELVAVELVLVIIGDKETLVCGAEPEVVPAVLEDDADLRFRNVVRETGFPLPDDAVLGREIAEHSLADDI